MLFWIKWRRGVVVITTAQLHSTKPELRFCAGSNPARGVLEICDGEDLWQWSRLEIRLNAFRRSTKPQKQFIIIIIMVNLRLWNFKLISRNVRFICCNIFSKTMVVCFSLKHVLLSFTFIIDISRFYNGLNHPRGSASFYFNRNIIEGTHEIVM